MCFWFSASSLLDSGGVLCLGPLIPALQNIEDQINVSNPQAGVRSSVILQPSSAPTSPQHRHESLISPPPCSPPPLPPCGGGISSSDPNFHAVSLRERNAAMLNNELMADVHFIVGTPGNLEVLLLYWLKVKNYFYFSVVYVHHM